MNFRTSRLPFAATGQFSQLFLDYVNDAGKLRPFYNYYPGAEDFGKILSDIKSFSYDRDTLVAVLMRQEAEQIARQPALAEQIERLRHPGTYTVCTGHQLCLFTGPLFFIYKLLSAVNLAEKLKQLYPENNFVPVYWMASEDHDFEEISSVHLFGKTVRWNEEAGGPVGRLSTAGLQPVLDELKTILGDSPAAQDLLALFAAAYDGRVSLATATRRLVHALFGKYKLLVLDGDDAELKKIFLPAIRAELNTARNEELVKEQSAALEKNGYPVQVHPRPVNLFYLDGNKRGRIEKEGAFFKILDTDLRFSQEELLAAAEKDPSLFSPNVVTRPLYQQTLLPNIAYVGGPGELAYWLQYKTMFEAQQVLLPVLVPRSFVMLIDKGAQEKMNRLGLSPAGLFSDAEQLVKEYVLRNSNGILNLSEEKEKLKSVFASVATKAAAIDPTLLKAAEAEMQKQVNALEAFESKILKAEKQKHETATGQIRKLKEKFFPGGVLQERYDNFLPYALAEGYAQWIDAVKNAIEPFSSEVFILEN